MYTETLKLALFRAAKWGSTYTWCRLIHGKIWYALMTPYTNPSKNGLIHNVRNQLI